MATDIHVLIVGAGVGGLALALMLERASISYELLEKSTEVRQLGTAITLSCIMQIFEQLDMYEELFSLSRPFGALHVRDEDLSYKGTFWSRPPGDDIEGLYGDYPRVIGRPDLIKLLMSRIPANRIHFGKRVLSTTQDEHQVIVKCADETTFTGSVLVGADGAYSSVRQNMYRELEKTGLLPKTDASPMGCSFECVVGISNPVSPDDYPVLKQDFSEFEIILGKEAPYTVWYLPMQNNRIGFLITHDVRSQGTHEQRTQRCSEWGYDAANNVLNDVRRFRCPYGGTLADIIDNTPKELISKVNLEDKFFNTWYSGRTVILGDACHKMLPFAGQGANMAILSALELTNLLYDMKSDTQTEITRIFKVYYKNRHSLAKWCVSSANQHGAMLHKKGVIGDLWRYLFLNWMPRWVIKRVTDSFHVYRPQLVFLPFVKIRGSLTTYTNKPSTRQTPIVSTSPRTV